MTKKYRHILLVCDENTRRVCGDRVDELLGDVIDSRLTYSGDGFVIPNEEAVARLEAYLNNKTDLIIGVGSGVINDLCKYVSYEHNLPYYVVATAPSMDGYASKGAAMLFSGMKITTNAAVPKAIIADTGILKDAPIEMLQAGYGDIMLLGQNVNSYKGDISFPELLRRAGSMDGEYFLRFMTSHPKDASTELVEVIRDVPNVAKHFHLPVQSGNNRVLSAMNRKYTREKYLEKALKIKSLVPGITMTTDIICGFPTETEEEFLETVDIIKQVEFDMIFTFLYSPRPGTPAAKMEDQIPHEEKVRRFELLSSVQNDIADKLNEKYIGKTVRVLCDSSEHGECSGRTSGNKIVNFKGKAMVGTFADVEITSAGAYILKGKEKDEK
jgi:hypothetical protein